MKDKQRILNFVEESKREMVDLQRILTAVPAIAPESGGEGELKKAEVLEGFLRQAGFKEILRLDAPDPRVESGLRPNLVAGIEGELPGPTLWIMSHLDIVPPGEMSLWESDPYSMIEKEGVIYGRGVEDNQQGLTASLFAVLAFLRQGIKPRYPVKLLFVADEEVGSEYGIKYLLKKSVLFRKGDWFLVPDSGRPDGTMLEVAEKSVLWLKFKTEGKQCHASMPELGRNAFLAASDLVLRIADLANKYPERNPIFDPPVSTFVPTKKEANVPNVNTLPGEDIFYLDCRILPSLPVDTVLKEIEARMKTVEEKYGVKISYTTVQRTESIPTSSEAPLVSALAGAVREVYDVEAKPVGIGGGTVAAYLRNEGYDTVVWSRLDESAHQPNEYCRLDNLVGDCKVMALLILEGRK